MAYSAPRTWVTSELVTSAIMNAHVRDQFLALGPLYDNTLGAAAANFDITTGLIGASLRIRLHARGDTAATNTAVHLRFNNDSGANYDYYLNYQHGANQDAGNVTNGATSGALGYMPAASAAAGLAGQFSVDVHNPDGTVLHKTAQGTFGSPIVPASGDDGVGETFVRWASTAAITRITLFPSAGNFLAGTRCTIHAAVET